MPYSQALETQNWGLIKVALRKFQKKVSNTSNNVRPLIKFAQERNIFTMHTFIALNKAKALKMPLIRSMGYGTK